MSHVARPSLRRRLSNEDYWGEPELAHYYVEAVRWSIREEPRRKRGLQLTGAAPVSCNPLRCGLIHGTERDQGLKLGTEQLN